MKIFTTNVIKFTWLLLPISLVTGAALYWRYDVCIVSSNQGRIQAVEVPVKAQTNGTVGTIFVQNYALVKRGDVIFDLNTTSFELAVANAQEKLTYTKKTVKAAEKAVTDIEKSLDSQQREISNLGKLLNYESPLVGDERKSALAQLEEDKAALEETEKRLQAAYQVLGKPGEAEAKVHLAEVDLADAQAKLPFIHVTAPIDGYIKNFQLRVGSPIKAQLPLFTVIQHNEWWVEAQFEPKALKRIHPYQLASIQLKDYPNITITGIVINTNKDQHQVKIKILDPNPFYLHIGGNTAVTIDTQKLWKRG